jgi:hypothetical protein
MGLMQQYPLLLRPGLRKDFLDTFKGWQTTWSQYLKSGTMDMPELSASIMTGLNRLYEVHEGEQVTFQEMVMGPKVAVVDKEYKSGYYVGLKSLEDDQYGKLNSGAKQLAHAAQLTKEMTAQVFLDDAFTGTYFKGIDNLSLFSTAHTLINSTTTVANRPTTAVSLSVSGFTQLLDLARKCKDENGDPIMVNIDTLQISNDQGQINKAHQILESQLEPFTANNQDNPIRRNFKPKSIIINPYMTTNLYHWHMFDSAMNDAHLLDRAKVTIKDWYDDETDMAKVKARGRWAIWFVDWRAWVGSNASS